MAIVITKVKENLKYIPLDERGKENPFYVLVKPLDSKILLTLEDRIVRREGEVVSFYMGKYSFDACKASIVGWGNITYEDGSDIQFKTSQDGLPTDETLASLGVELIQEIANVVSAISRDKSKIPVFFPADE